ncbi:MAG: translation initiation factor IF-6, partial [Candidatus Diapherotrites archaeon]|nr:translation initiation factor IF-6 [Candidatus Diapherotrites archaeon]
GNNNGFITGDSSSLSELDGLRELGVKIEVISSEQNALGNLISCNDTGCVASDFLKDQKKDIEKALGVDVKLLKVAGLDIVGSCIACNNKGFLINPNASSSEFNIVKKALGVDGAASTANYGDVFVSHSILANSNGVLVGSLTTGPELMRVIEGLNV